MPINLFNLNLMAPRWQVFRQYWRHAKWCRWAPGVSQSYQEPSCRPWHDRLGRLRPTHISIGGGRTQWVQVACQQLPALLRPPTLSRQLAISKANSQSPLCGATEARYLAICDGSTMDASMSERSDGDQVGPRRTVYQAVVLVADQKM